MKYSPLYLLGIFLLFIACSKDNTPSTKEEYEGPAIAMENVDLLLSDSAVITLRLVAAKQLDYYNKDREFPEGIYLEFYNVYGKMTSTLKANKGYYFAEEDYYKAEGNVIMKSLLKGDELTTELLNWVPSEERIHTDKFVTIKTIDEILTGEGLESTEDFEEYTILKPSGTMRIKGKKSDENFDETLEFEEDTTFLQED